MTIASIYTRTHRAHAWKFNRTTNRECAMLENEVNASFGIETLLVNVSAGSPILAWLDANTPATPGSRP